MAAERRLLTPDEAAGRLGVGERTLRDLRKRGLIRYVAVTERKIMYRPEDCEAFIESRSRLAEPTTPPKRPPTNRPRRQGQVIPLFSEVSR
jgi:excisionase family DNA binding protein